MVVESEYTQRSVWTNLNHIGRHRDQACPAHIQVDTPTSVGVKKMQICPPPFFQSMHTQCQCSAAILASYAWVGVPYQLQDPEWQVHVLLCVHRFCPVRLLLSPHTQHQALRGSTSPVCVCGKCVYACGVHRCDVHQGQFGKEDLWMRYHKNKILLFAADDP